MSDRDPQPSTGDEARIGDAFRDLTDADHERRRPPAAVWDGIAAELGLERDDRRPASTGAEGETDHQRRDEGDPVPDLLHHRRRRRAAIDRRRTVMAGLSAAAAVVVAVVAIGFLRDDGPTALAQAALAHDEGFDPLGVDAAATAALVDADGRLLIEIDEASLPPRPDDADLELWLIDPDDEGQPSDLVSLGLVDPASPGTFEVPAGYDPDVFNVVDISVEPRDGDPDHSGRSILRGALVATGTT